MDIKKEVEKVRYRPTLKQKKALKKYGYMPNTLAQEAVIKKNFHTMRKYSVKVNRRTGVSTVRQAGKTIILSPRGKVLSRR